MICVCHPEATDSSPPADLSARLAHILNHNHSSYGGGKSGAQVVQTRSFRAVYPALGSVSHRLLVSAPKLPIPLPICPLSTTFTHILSLSRLLSSINFEVADPLRHRPMKLR